MFNIRHLTILLAFLTLALAIPIALQVRYEKLKGQYSLTQNTISSQTIAYQPENKSVLAATSGPGGNTTCEQQGFECAATENDCIGGASGVTTKGTCSASNPVCCIRKKLSCESFTGAFCLQNSADNRAGCFIASDVVAACSSPSNFCCLQASPRCNVDIQNGQCKSENTCQGAVLTNTGLCPGSASNPNIVCCVESSGNTTVTPTPTTSSSGGTTQPTATPTGLPTSPLCGGEYVCDPCDCPAGQTCDQKCYKATTHELCLSQSCSNDPNNQIFTQTCEQPGDSNYNFCTDPTPGGMGFKSVSCTGGSQCTGIGGGGCRYCQTAVIPTATPANFSFVESQSCNANYSITENPNKKDIAISISASTSNANCPVLLKNGVFDASIVCKFLNGKIECNAQNTGNGKHVFELRFGQNMLYGRSCGQPVSCNNVEFALTGSANGALVGDMDNNGVVNVADFANFKSCYTDVVCQNRSKLDLNNDNTVDIIDYNIMISRVTL